MNARNAYRRFEKCACAHAPGQRTKQPARQIQNQVQSIIRHTKNRKQKASIAGRDGETEREKEREREREKERKRESPRFTTGLVRCGGIERDGCTIGRREACLGVPDQQSWREGKYLACLCLLVVVVAAVVNNPRI